MFLLILTLLGCLFQTEPPFKPSDEFRIEMEYMFKPRPLVDNSNTIVVTETRKEHDRKMSGGEQLPYLILHIHMNKLSAQETRVRVIDNLGDVRLTKKLEQGKSYKLDMGYTADVKDRVTAYEYNVYFLSDDKEKVSRIHLLVMDDGTFMVNDEKRGKF